MFSEEKKDDFWDLDKLLPKKKRSILTPFSMKEKTVIFVTHRNTSLKVCDKIIYVEDKKFNVIKE